MAAHQGGFPVLKDFRNFIERGNVLDLAVAVILGVAFNDVVKSFTNDVLMQIIAVITGGSRPSFDYSVTIRETSIRYGSFLTALINFLIIAFAAFLIVKAIQSAQNLRRKDEEDTEVKLTEVELLEEIRDLLADRQKGSSILHK
jgi:large conductance mechanosensitive channel